MAAKHRKLILLLVLALLVPLGLRAAAPPTETDQRLLQRLKGGDLPQEASESREAFSGELMRTMNQGSPRGAKAWKAQDYDALFALLQKYRDDIKKFGFSQTEFENELAMLKAKAIVLKERVDNIHPLDGMKIHGKVVASYGRVFLGGPGAAGTGGLPLKDKGERVLYNEMRTRALFAFTITRGPMTFQSDLGAQLPFGGSSGGRLGVQRIFLEIRSPFGLQIGDIYPQLTPLTLWRHKDWNDYEPNPFRTRRQRIEDFTYLKDNRLSYRGLRLLGQLEIMEKQNIGAEITLIKMANPGGKVGSVTAVYETFFTTWQAWWKPMADLKFAYTGTSLFDSVVSADEKYTTGPIPALDGKDIHGMMAMVHSGGVKGSLLDGLIKAEIEGAISQYNSPRDDLFKTAPLVVYDSIVAGTAYFADVTVDHQ